MATGWATLILLSAAGAGWTLECFESVCFPHERADCADPEAMEAKPCDREAAYYVMSRKLGVKHALRVNSSVSFNCAKVVGTSNEPGQENKQMNLRLCHPRVDNQCEMMESIFDEAIRKAGVMDLKMDWKCEVCREDRCNSALRPAGVPAVLLSSAAVSLALVAALGPRGMH